MFDRCPKAMLRNELMGIADMIGDVMLFRENGAMPLPGALLDQDPRWIEAVGVVNAALLEVRKPQEAQGGR